MDTTNNTTSDASMEDSLAKVRDVMGYGLFLQVLTIMTHFTFEKKKTEAMQKLQDFMKTFDATLTEEEKVEYKTKVDEFLKGKGEEMVSKLQSELTPEELEQLLPQLLDAKYLEQAMHDVTK